MTDPFNEDQDSTLVSTAAMLALALANYGLDIEEFLSDLGVAPEDYSDPNGRVPLSLMQSAWNLAVEKTGDPCFGLSLAQVVQPAALHGLGLSMLSSDSLKEAVVRTVRYRRVVSTVIRVLMEPKDGGYQVEICTKNYKIPPVPTAVDATMTVLMQMLRITAGEKIRPEWVTFQHSAPPCHARFDEYFGCPVSFSRSQNLLFFNSEVFERELPNSHPELARANDRVVIEYLDTFERKSLELQVREQIIERLPSGTPNEAVIASKLNMSLRNLQRQLKAEGISYKQILDETRKALAIRYLEDSERQIIEISYLLGFSEQSNFSRAFKRWTGSSPQRHRLDSEQATVPQ